MEPDRYEDPYHADGRGFDFSMAGYSALAYLALFRSSWKKYVWLNRIWDPDDLPKQCAGEMLDVFIGNNQIVRFSFMVALVGARFSLLFKQYANLNRSYAQVLENCKEEHPYPIQHYFFKKTKGQLGQLRFSALTFLIMHKQISRGLKKTCRIARALLNLGKNSFELTMRIMDVMAIFFIQKDKAQEIWHSSATESIFNIQECASAIQQNKASFLFQMESTYSYISSILKRWDIHSLLEEEAFRDGAELFVNALAMSNLVLSQLPSDALNTVAKAGADLVKGWVHQATPIVLKKTVEGVIGSEKDNFWNQTDKTPSKTSIVRVNLTFKVSSCPKDCQVDLSNSEKPLFLKMKNATAFRIFRLEEDAEKDGSKKCIVKKLFD